jgi:anti-sigma-K factor RskA
MTRSAPHYEVSGALRRRVLQAVRAEPRTASSGLSPRVRRRRLTLPVAIAIAIGAAIATGALAHGGGTPRVIRASVGRAQLRIAGGHGELIVDYLPPAPPHRIYELWLQHGARAPAPSTLFAVTSRGTAELGLPGELTGVTRVLVTLEPADGSLSPTTEPVIAARL